LTTAEHWLKSATTIMFVGTVITGGSVSGLVAELTVTVKVPVVTLPSASVAVTVTVVLPTGKEEPEAGLPTTVGVEQLSVAVAT
jgi:hypothetical protein